MAASPKEKFEAAVKVIQSLPKNDSTVKSGSFQPSHELMLKFYAYFKQANFGKCNCSRPAFWDVVGKAKWDAWNSLGDMSKDQAMLNYVDELKKVLVKNYPNGYDRQEIVEAMPHTAMVQDFVQKLDNFYDLVDPKPPAKPQETPKMNGDMGNGNGHPENGNGLHDDVIDERLLEGQQMASGEQTELDVLSVQKKPQKKPTKEGDEDIPVEEAAILQNASRDMSTPVKPPKKGKPDKNFNDHNGDNNRQGDAAMGNGTGTHRDGPNRENEEPSRHDDSESEIEEFCDTSDSPHSQQKHDLDLTEDEDEDQSDISPPPLRYPANPDPASVSLTSMPSSSALLHPGQALAEGFMSPTQILGTSESGVFSTNPSFSDLGERSWQGKSARGAGELQPGNMGTMPTPSPAPGSSGQSARSQSRAPSGRSQLLAAGGSGGQGGGGNGGAGPNRPEVTQQIAVALVQLQQDMNSVLSRLNTLEALTVAQTQRRSRQNSGSSNQGGDSWWPLSTRRSQWFFIFAWPFIVHWLIAFISKRRNRRR